MKFTGTLIKYSSKPDSNMDKITSKAIRGMKFSDFMLNPIILNEQNEPINGKVDEINIIIGINVNGTIENLDKGNYYIVPNFVAKKTSMDGDIRVIEEMELVSTTLTTKPVDKNLEPIKIIK